MKVILLLLVSWSLTAWSEQPLTTEEFTQLRLKSYERVATKNAHEGHGFGRFGPVQVQDCNLFHNFITCRRVGSVTGDGNCT